mmetsp:Transcript_5468/g.16200  ORF Transcript_5468/g.16200 Transcript_5468/m.16200 type:complete len:255 (-) Transcript_5468:364-1128(-)
MSARVHDVDVAHDGRRRGRAPRVRGRWRVDALQGAVARGAALDDVGNGLLSLVLILYDVHKAAPVCRVKLLMPRFLLEDIIVVQHKLPFELTKPRGIGDCRHADVKLATPGERFLWHWHRWGHHTCISVDAWACKPSSHRFDWTSLFNLAGAARGKASPLPQWRRSLYRCRCIPCCLASCVGNAQDCLFTLRSLSALWVWMATIGQLCQGWSSVPPGIVDRGVRVVVSQRERGTGLHEQLAHVDVALPHGVKQS